ncbi:leucine-rich repeat-containing protein 4B-like [Haliotis rubra]|uniref:leucine-rich repeat-containing protein 4B-like n=1 Tax=Haliotis rubra TaxID=36100 RepID=UPI001EE524B6|nr:leucine-rich repeat-containing protein 4B-like [Haliotis rubra]
MKQFYLTAVVLYITAGLYSVASVPADCPQLTAIIPQCNCESSLDQATDIVINCRRKGLTTFPTINGSYTGLIYEFTLAFNDIETVPDDAFQGLRIKRLDLTSNKLSNISDVAFRNLEADLTVLKLSGGVNGMSAPFTAMVNLVNLQELTLENFLIQNGDLENSNYFQPFSALQKLTLKNWNLKSVASTAFTGLTSLKELYIQQQPNLTSLPVGAIDIMQDTIEKLRYRTRKLQHYMLTVSKI